MFNTVLNNTCKAVPLILSYVSLDPELMHLQMEDFNQYIQDSTSDYLVSTHAPEEILPIPHMT